MSKILTTRCTPAMVRVICVARFASRSETRPIRYTVPRSVTTLKALTCRSLASISEALTLPVTRASLARCCSEGAMPMTVISLTTARTLSTRAISCSTACLSCSLRASPVSRTCRL